MHSIVKAQGSGNLATQSGNSNLATQKSIGQGVSNPPNNAFSSTPKVLQINFQNQ